MSQVPAVAGDIWLTFVGWRSHRWFGWLMTVWTIWALAWLVGCRCSTSHLVDRRLMDAVEQSAHDPKAVR